MSKIKKIVLILSAFLSLGFFGSIPALAAGDGAKNPACTGIQKDPKISCAECYPDSGNAPSLCNCHPEYHYGAPLTTEELASCEKCNQAGLEHIVDNKGASPDQKQAANSKLQDCLQNNQITKDINIFVDVLSALATIVIIGTLIAGGIQYSMAGNPQAATNARKRISNGVLALVALFFIWAFLQWLIPGGI